jgi:hypothetical protein
VTTQEAFEDADELSAFVEVSCARGRFEDDICGILTTQEVFDDVDDDVSVFVEFSFAKLGVA